MVPWELVRHLGEKLQGNLYKEIMELKELTIQLLVLKLVIVLQEPPKQKEAVF